MERSEPTLVPEWLKSSVSLTGGGTAIHQFASSSLQSDDRAVSKPARNKSLVNISDQDSGRSPVSDRTTSSYFRRSSSSNGSAHSRSYSSFGRTHHNRDWDKDINEYRDKEKSVLGYHRPRDYLDPLGKFFPSRLDKDGLRRSHSVISGKNNNNTNGNLSSPIRSLNKAGFERDFPSLGAEERRLDPVIGCAPSPGLSTALQSLPVGSSAVIGCDGWTSALAEVPVIIGKNGTGSASVSASTMSGLNMAETLAQGPPRVQATTQVSVGTQRLEELAIKQSRQLIPMTPSMPKALVLNTLEKPKSKVGQQQQHHISSPHLVNLSPRGGPTKPDASKTSGSVGKLHLLKPARERNSISPSPKDSLSPTSVSKIANSPLAIAPSVVGPAPLRTLGSNPSRASADRKPAMAVSEKRPTSQAQSRNDFFNLVRKKSMTNSSSVAADPKPSETEVAPAFSQSRGDAPLPDRLNRSQLSASSCDVANNGDARESPQKFLNSGNNHSSSIAILYSEEEEAAFLRSLGWEENTGEDEGLTEEEISAFYRDVSKYIKSRPSSRVFQGMQPRFSMLADSQIESVGGISAGLGPSESKLES